MPKLPRFRRRRAAPPAVAPLEPIAHESEPSPAPGPEGQAEAQPGAEQTPGSLPAADEPAAAQAETPAAPEAGGGAPAADAPTTPIPPIQPSGDLSSGASGGAPRGFSPTPPSLWPDWSRRLLAGLILLAVAGVGFAAGFLIEDDSDDSDSPGVAPAVIVESSAEPEAIEQIGFPEFATRNTTRVGGADAIANGAGVALASYPSLGGVGGPGAVALAPADSWQAALAAAPLAADPVGAPILLSEAREMPDLTADAVAGLAPQGLEDAEGIQAIQIAGVAVPDDLETLAVGSAGDDPATLAAKIDAERERLTGEKDPDHILVVSSEAPELAMPAASWAARSGDPILFAAGDEVPEATLEVIAEHEDTPVYVLAPESAISAKALGQLEKDAGGVTRISNEEDPVESSIEFARFVDGDFGWNINDPGHGFVIASSERPLDAAVGAPLSAGGKPGPLLVTTNGLTVPAALQGFLTDTQPGFVDDPSRALYNHVWLLGNTDAISVAFQAQVDELTKLVPVSGGTSGPEFSPVPGAPEDEEVPDSGEPDSEERDGRADDGDDGADAPPDDSGDTR